MSVNYNTTTINDRLQDVISNIDAGAGNGVMVLSSSASATMASITLQKPCGAVSGGVLTFAGLPLGGPLVIETGYIAGASVQDSAGTTVISGLTVGLSTSYDIVMASTLVSSGDSIALTYATITGR